jgi:hypothetical protein
LTGLDLQSGASELYSFRALISETELRQLMQLNNICGCGVDFMKANDDDIKALIKQVTFDEAPDSNLIIKKSNVKRDKGAFSKFKDATAVLTRDK